MTGKLVEQNSNWSHIRDWKPFSCYYTSTPRSIHLGWKVTYGETESTPDIYVTKKSLKFITVCRQGKHVQLKVLLYLTLKEFRDIFFSLLNGRLGMMINNSKATTNTSQVSIIHLISYFQDSLVLQVCRGELTID